MWHQFDLDFFGPEEEPEWVRDSVCGRLRALVDEGRAARAKFGANHNDDVYWRTARPAAECSFVDKQSQLDIMRKRFQAHEAASGRAAAAHLQRRP